jgi:glycosyltransferase involved in cell wall biosynthesis
MRVAYLVNQYPSVSHSFIRREVAALEGHGVAVERFSVRQPPPDLVDPADQAEAKRTRALLAGGKRGLLFALLATAAARPVRFLTALRFAVRLGRRSDRGVLRHLAYLAEACVLLRLLRANPVEHLHAHFGTNPAAVALLLRLLGGPPYSFTVHGPEEFDRPEALSLGDKIAHARFVVGVSDFGRSQLFRWSDPAEWDKVRVVHCGLDAAFLHAERGPVPDAPRLVCVGRLAEQKGHLLLLEALRPLADEGVPFEMVLAGDGPLRSLVERRIKESGLLGRVRITGWLSNDAVRRELLASRALVLPSFAEGLPVVLMEAMALGRPVVTTYIAGIPELVQDGVHGWLVPAGSVAALTTAVRDVLRSPRGHLETLGRAGVEQVKGRHDAAVEAGKLARLFRGEGLRGRKDSSPAATG